MDTQIDQGSPIDMCFVSSIFGESEYTADRPSDVSQVWFPNEEEEEEEEEKKEKEETQPFSTTTTTRRTTTFRFFLFTNLETMDVSEGWYRIVLRDLPYRRFITQSRYPKFMGWKHPALQNCTTVYYFDGHYQLNPDRLDDFATTSRQILTSSVGLAQVPHPHKRTVLQEFSRILYKHKDIPSNVEKSIQWFFSQPDFDNTCTLYQNAFFGYDPSNELWQKVVTYFWDHYSLEQDSWRDQPLWCYTLQHFNVTPLLLEDEPYGLFEKDKQRTGHNDHQYDESSDNVVVAVVATGGSSPGSSPTIASAGSSSSDGNRNTQQSHDVAPPPTTTTTV
jgi:hypothetical protein